MRGGGLAKSIVANQPVSATLNWIKTQLELCGGTADLDAGWVRFNNGLQVVWDFSDKKFSSHKTTITFPKPFLNTDYGVSFISKRTEANVRRINGWTATTVEFVEANLASVTISISYIAIGRWK